MGQLSETDITAFVKDFYDHTKGNVSTIARLYALAAEVLIHLVGKEWVRDNVFGKAPLDNFLRSVSDITEDKFKHADRVISLSEMLFHFQSIDGIEKRITEIKTSSVEDTVGELEGAKLLYTSSIPFRFVLPVGRRGSDFDVQAFASDGSGINCEMKTKASETILSTVTVWNTLHGNRNQLPKGEAGIMFLKIPEDWVLQSEISQIMAESLNRFFRGTDRVAAVIIHWEEWYFVPDGPAIRVVKYRRELNPHSSFRDLVASEVLEKFSAIGTNNVWKYFAGYVATNK